MSPQDTHPPIRYQAFDRIEGGGALGRAAPLVAFKFGRGLAVLIYQIVSIYDMSIQVHHRGQVHTDGGLAEYIIILSSDPFVM